MHKFKHGENLVGSAAFVCRKHKLREGIEIVGGSADFREPTTGTFSGNAQC